MVKELMLKPEAMTHSRMVWKPAVSPPDPSACLFAIVGEGFVLGWVGLESRRLETHIEEKKYIYFVYTPYIHGLCRGRRA